MTYVLYKIGVMFYVQLFYFYIVLGFKIIVLINIKINMQNVVIKTSFFCVCFCKLDSCVYTIIFFNLTLKRSRLIGRVAVYDVTESD